MGLSLKFLENEVKLMSYETFMYRVNALIAEADDSDVSFTNDLEKGKYFARFADGMVIIGRPTSLKVTVRWGTSHTALVII